MSKTQTYNVTIQETLTYNLNVRANNRGMAKIRTKAEAAHICCGNPKGLIVTACEPVQPIEGATNVVS